MSEIYDDIFKRIALVGIAFREAQRRGRVPTHEVKAYEARRAELIAELDEARGTADVAYAQLRDALDRDADCEALFELRKRMHPKDPLKAAATEDLQSIGCLSPTSKRNEPSGGEAGR